MQYTKHKNRPSQRKLYSYRLRLYINKRIYPIIIFCHVRSFWLAQRVCDLFKFAHAVLVTAEIIQCSSMLLLLFVSCSTSRI
jgi:hypothetical protein